MLEDFDLKLYCIFEEEGLYKFDIVFNDLITNLENFFEDCTNIISLDFSNFNFSNIINMSFMFKKCEKLKEIKGLNRFITNKPTDIKGIFSFCPELEYLDLSNFDTSNVINMREMFYKCEKLKEIKGLNEFDTNDVTNMGAMFASCPELEYLDLSNFDTSNVTIMNSMFSGCKRLKEIKGLNHFNTNKVTDMNGMFLSCSEIRYLDLSSFDTSNVIKMIEMFSKCENIKQIKGLNKLITNNVIYMQGMFSSCSGLEYLDLSNFDT